MTGADDKPMRADVRRNRRLILDAAVKLILEIGGEPSRDAVAQRAGVGIATLYRHFPDQQQLLSAVVLDVLDRTITAGEHALDQSATGGEALSQYLHAAIDIGLGAVNIIHPLLDTTIWPNRRAAAQDMLDRLVRVARRDGAVPNDFTVSEITFTAIRFCRPLAIGLETVEERTVAHQQLDTYLDGLAARRGLDEPSAPTDQTRTDAATTTHTSETRPSESARNGQNAPMPDTALPSIGAPATRALASIGVTTLEQVAERNETELLALHGFGPRALRIIHETLGAHGLCFRTLD